MAKLLVVTRWQLRGTLNRSRRMARQGIYLHMLSSNLKNSMITEYKSRLSSNYFSDRKRFIW